MAGNARPPIDDGAVLITGASAGIGRALAARARMHILLARRAGRMEELRASLLAGHPRLKVLTLSVDLSDENDVERALADQADWDASPEHAAHELGGTQGQSPPHQARRPSFS